MWGRVHPRRTRDLSDTRRTDRTFTGEEKVDFNISRTKNPVPKPGPARWWKDIHLTVPDATKGDWEIQTGTVTRAQEENARFQALLGSPMTAGIIRYERAGTYKRLVHKTTLGFEVVMSDTHDELMDHRVFFELASYGQVLVNGLGLGLCIEGLVGRVDHLWIIEREQAVIDLVEPYYQEKYPGFTTVIHADALEFRPADLAIRFDAVWHDIWNKISYENLPQMHKLHRKWGRWADWQGSWCRHQCEMLNRG